MTREERKSRRWIWSLAAGVLLVPVMSVGAIANSSGTTRDAVHAKESRGLGHAHVSVEHTVQTETREAAFDVHDHPVFDTPAEHKDFHGLPSGIDHDDHAVFDTPAEHKEYHGIIARFVRDDAARDDAVADDQPVHRETSDDAAADPAELKDQPLDRPEEKSTDRDSSTNHTRDRSDRDQETREERTN